MEAFCNSYSLLSTGSTNMYVVSETSRHDRKNVENDAKYKYKQSNQLKIAKRPSHLNLVAVMGVYWYTCLSLDATWKIFVLDILEDFENASP